MDCVSTLIHSCCSSSVAADIRYTVCLPSTTYKTIDTEIEKKGRERERIIDFKLSICT